MTANPYKKIIPKVLLALILLLAPIGCKYSVTSPVEGLVNLGEAARAQALVVDQGEKFYLEYAEHESVGSKSEAESLHPEVVKLSDTLTAFDKPEKMKEGMTGGDSSHGYYVFEALKPGVADLLIKSKFRDEQAAETTYLIMVKAKQDLASNSEIRIDKSDIETATFDQRPGSSGHLMIGLNPDRLKKLKEEIDSNLNQETVLSIVEIGSLLVKPNIEPGKRKLKHVSYGLEISNSKLEVWASIGQGVHLTSPSVYLPMIEISKSLEK